MASTRTARLRRALIGSIILAGSVVALPTAAHATPHPQAPQTSSDVVARLADLAKSNEKLTEAFNQARIDVVKLQKRAADATASASSAKATLRSAQQSLADALATRYKSASFSHTAALLSSQSGQSYLETVQTLNILSLHQGQVAQAATDAAAAAQKAENHGRALVSTAIAKRLAINKQRDVIQSEVTKQKALLATLTAAEQQSFVNAGAPTTQQLTSAPVAAPSNAAGVAVQAALAEQGKPYVWGAAGPDSFDCSGLTMWAWGKAGVSLPHNAAAQQGMGTQVSQSQLAPGDLVFFGSPAYHVAMYIGNGLIVEAPTTGQNVKTVSLSSMSDYSGAARF